ncbi:MAG: class I tRNA ligase family protein [Patescibacteria group bacterium]|nr:class I tRNA ligase family protein [Patescibacteria group bacterium]MCL5262089.1 class I tRNA ligase family protein [Patescibacteria group bacterium]
MKTRKKFYITTSIAYVNAAPHIGFALELVLADTIARYRRSLADDVFFLTGTDEHGEKISRMACSAGKSPKAFASAISEKFRALRGKLDLSYDDFIRTSDKKRHWPGALALWKRIEENGDIYQKKYEGLYCVGCERFITKKELLDGRCPIHKTEPEVIEEENYFFKLSNYRDELYRIIESGEYLIVPESRKNEVLSFLSAGLEDISFSRPKAHVPWGIPIPKTDQTMYVWCDALSNYISALGFGRKGGAARRFRKFWPADVHLIGKDILRFHAVIWPAMLLSAKLPLPKKLFVHGFITVDGVKMSKSLGNVVDPVDLVERYGSEPVRYYLLREIPSNEDGDFSETKFVERYSADLSNGLGNFASRVLNLGAGLVFRGQKIGEKTELQIKRAEAMVSKHMEEFRIHEAVSSVWELLKFGDGYVNETKPWKTKDKQAIFDLLIILESAARLLAPFLPEAAGKIKKCFRRRGGTLRVSKIKPLFPRISG